MKAHGISTEFRYEIFDNEKKILEDVRESKLKGYVILENRKTGKTVKLPFRSFVDNFIQTIHGHLSGDGGDDTKLQTVSLAANSTAAASLGIILGNGISSKSITDTALGNALVHASLAYDTHVFTAPYTSGYNMGFDISRLLTNNKSSTVYPTEVGVMTRLASTASVATPGTAKRMIAHDLLSFSIPADDSVRITFAFEANQIADQGGIVLNFVKFIYNILFKGNLNHTSSRIISRAGGTPPTYQMASLNASKAATLGELFVGNAGTGYIGICIEIFNEDATPISPSSTSVTPDHTDLTASANVISAIEYATISNGAAFTITRTFTNSGTTGKILGRAALLTRGATANTGTTLHADQALLMYNKIGTEEMIALSPGQSIRLTYKIGIEV